ncbi:MAG TPA: exopolysaccharide biosynthesis protein [Pseudomonas xinjiangensis]|uniref:Exopolysaccharide biosynthesis protein n=2 Tax=root TaxID=1 RepID=A0A7V1BMN8_9GAMM|nr:exopolysaccharide biosynthesis protein [Halopseudomonas xinjiangensis]HEC46868.1 exopolysaccharide biosynthesis protein [Halopseudomonas xinjiangensis]
MSQELQNLEQLFDHLARLARGRDQVSLGIVVDSIGRRSFGPLLMLIGITLVSPLSGIPGMATIMAVFVMLIAVQMLLGRTHFWLPKWLLSRAINHDRLLKIISWGRPLAVKIDRVLRPRLPMLVHHGGGYVIALLCLLISLCMPVMEMVPFSASAAGAALAAFGLSLVMHDGLLVLMAVAWVIATFALVVVNIV